MSHTSTIKTNFRDAEAVTEAAEALGYTVEYGTARLFTGPELTGLVMRIPGWRYPVIINTETGTAKYDNYKGSWGSSEHLDAFKQRYAACVTKKELSKKFPTATLVEETTEDGRIVITASVGSARSKAGGFGGSAGF